MVSLPVAEDKKPPAGLAISLLTWGHEATNQGLRKTPGKYRLKTNTYKIKAVGELKIEMSIFTQRKTGSSTGTVAQWWRTCKRPQVQATVPQEKKKKGRLERWLSRHKPSLLLQGTQIWSPAPTSGDSHPPITPAPEVTAPFFSLE